MKKKILFLTVMLISTIMFSFKNPPQNEWGRWYSFSNYPGLDFRVKKYEYNSYAKKWMWQFQFRNRYQTSVTFQYGYSALSSSCKTDHTEYNLGAGKESSVTADLSDAISNIYVCADNLKLGN